MDGGRVVSGLTPCQSSSQKPEVKQAQTARHSWLRGGLTVGKFISPHSSEQSFCAAANLQSSAAAAPKTISPLRRCTIARENV